MQKLLLNIDRLSVLIGQTFAWCIVLLTGVVVYEVVARYAFRAPTGWGFDASYMLYGTLFMMAGAYALSRNGHVRGDFLYRNFRPTLQAKFDLVLYLLFFFPGMLALMISGYSFFAQSFAQNEHSAFSPTGPVIWPLKGLIPLVGALMLLQGVAEVIRCVRCIRDGAWPPRLSDVEELEQQILAEAASVKDPALVLAAIAAKEARR